jgi:hypothetical protein
MFGRSEDEEFIPKKKKSFYKQFKKTILVLCLLFAGGMLLLNSFNLIQFNPDLIKYTGGGLIGLAFIYYYLY